MSREIDEKVVSMQFDNRKFESNVHTSLTTLEKLKKSLNFKGAADSLEGVNEAAKKVDFSQMEKAAYKTGFHISDIFLKLSSVLEFQVARRLIAVGKNVVSAFTIDPIKTGLAEYETQINAVQTILANTESKGTTLEDVNNALDILNKYADKTIYNFTEMTRNIGTFTAAGIDLDTSVQAIQGIANLAAVSGSNSQQASTAMYQLSQALSSGTVKLMDWNSVVNAGMGGQVFQDALKETARVHDIAIDDMIESEGSFRETLHSGWLTSEILTETLAKFTMATDGLTEAEIKKNKEILKGQGYTDEQIEGILKLGDTATNAATKVKTFTQLMDTLKEAAQSGWTQTWETIIGDFEEAKTLWTSVSDTIGGIINTSAEARNALVSGWAEGGGREMGIEAIKNVFQSLISIVNPIREAFREIFPPATAEKLIKITENIKDFTAKLILSEEAQARLKAVAKGLFSVIDIGVTIIKEIVVGIGALKGNVAGLIGSIFGVTGSFSKMISKFRDTVKETGFFSTVISGVVNVLGKLIDKIRIVIDFLNAKILAPGFEGIYKLFSGIWTVTKWLAEKLGSLVSAIVSQLGSAFRNGDIEGAIDLFSSGVIAAILLNIKSFVGNFKESIESITGLSENISEILDSVKGAFEAYQNDLKANTLLKIAGAIGILAISLLLIASIDPEKLTSALMAITLLFANLMGSMAIFTKIVGGSVTGLVRASISMTIMSIAILVLASALKTISSIDTDSMITGIMGIAALSAVVVLISKALSKNTGAIIKGTTGLITFAIAIKILASAVEDISSLSWEQMVKGLLGVAALIAVVSVFVSTTKFNSKVISTAIGITILAASMKIFASAIKDLSSFSWIELQKGLVGIAGTLIIMALALKMMPKNMVTIGLGLLAVSASLLIISKVVSTFSEMGWKNIGKGLLTLGGSLAILAIALKAMTGTIAGSAALLVAAIAIGLLTPSLLILGSMSWESIGKGLLTLAAAFAILGVAGALLTPLIPSIMGLAIAMALIGVGVLAFSAGITALSIGITALASAFSAGSAIIVAGITAVITGLILLIPSIVTAIGQGIIQILDVISKSVTSITGAVTAIITAILGALDQSIPKIVDVVFKLFDTILTKLVEYTPKMVKAVYDILIACLEGIAEGLPKVVTAAVDIIVAFVDGITENLPRVIQAGFDLIIGFLDGLTNAINDNVPIVVEKVKELFKAILRAAVLVLTGGIVDIKGLGKKIMESGFIKGVKEKFDAVKKTVSEAIDKAKKAIVDKISEWVDIGEDIMAGLIKGVKSKFTSIKDAAVEGVKGAVDKVKNFLGIHSPSKAFYDIGSYSGQGMVNGLNSYSKKVSNSSEILGKSAVKSMNKTISGISDAVSSDIDSQPTIRPVLDLSDVSSGASAIGSMLNMQPGIGVMANVGSINSMMNRNQNGVNSDMLSAIKDLNTKLDNIKGDTYNLNGITYDDGSNIATAIGQLVRAAKIERRI